MRAACRGLVPGGLAGAPARVTLPDKAADAGYFCDSWHSLQRVTQMPILQAAQIGKAAFSALIDDGIFIHPACARRIGAD